jgi:transcriptional regulator with XRE-family HTH domain
MSESRNEMLKAFGQLVRQRRQALGISQEELGYRAGLDRTYVSGLERGVRNPSLTALVSLAHGFGISVSDLASRLEQEMENAD